MAGRWVKNADLQGIPAPANVADLSPVRKPKPRTTSVSKWPGPGRVGIFTVKIQWHGNKQCLGFPSLGRLLPLTKYCGEIGQLFLLLRPHGRRGGDFLEHGGVGFATILAHTF